MNKILAVDATAPKLYDLSEVASPATLSSTDSRRVIEMSLPLKTNTLLFYGRALEGTTAYDGYTLKDCYGYMDTYNVTATAGSADFSMGSRLEASKKTDFYAVEKLLAGILSVTMNTNLAGDHHVAISGTAAPGDAVKPYKFDVAADEYPTTLTWADYANADGKSPVTPADDLYPLEVKLANLYSQMVTINTGGGELRAASGDAIIKTVTDLWTVINAVRCADPFNEEEAVAKYLANSIHIRLSKYFTASVPSDGAPVTDVAFIHMADESGEDGLLTNFKSAYEMPVKI